MTTVVCQHVQLHLHPANASDPNSTSYVHSHLVSYEGLTYCALPSYDDFTLHFFACAGTLVVLLALSLLMSSCRNAWQGETVARVLRSLVRKLGMSRKYLFVIFVFSFLTSVLHIWRTQAGDRFGNILSHKLLALANQVETVGCVLQLLETLVVWLYSTANSAGGIGGLPCKRLLIDSFVVPSLLIRAFVESQHSHFAFGYFALLRAFGIWSAFRSTLSVHWEGIAMQLLHSALVLVTFILFTSLMLQQLESLDGAPWPFPSGVDSQYPAQRWSMASSIYFVLATVTTVGFGDLWPRSLLGQLATIVIALRGIYLLAQSALGIGEAVHVGWGGGGRYEKNTRSKHVVVSGNPSYQMLVDFVQELYHEENMKDADDLNLVLLLGSGPGSPLQPMKRFFVRPQNRYLRHKVWILQGSAIKRQDLDRVAYKDANMAWLLPNIYAEDSQREDVDNAMRALAMLRHAKFVRVVCVTLRTENRILASSVGVPHSDILVAAEMKVGILGKACQVQGFAAWSAILLKHTSVPSLIRYDASRPWMPQFNEGLQNEVYEVKLSKSYKGAPFGAIALDILERSGGKAFLVGFIEEAVYPGDTTSTYIFPGRSTHIGTNEEKLLKGILIAADKEDIKQHSESQNFAWSSVVIGSSEVAARAGLAKRLGASHLPNAVPEPLASEGAQGYVREWYELEEEKLASTETLMVAAAKLRAAKGVQTQAGVSRAQAEMLVGGVPAGAQDVVEAGGDGGGGAAQALLSQHLEAQREAELEGEAAEIDFEIKENKKNLARYRRAMDVVEYEEDEKWRGLEPRPDEQEADDGLWGAPPPPAPALFGAPREPPPELLVRGGHVLVLALDASASQPGGRAGGSPTGGARQAELPPGNRHGLRDLARSLHSGIPRHRARPLVILASQVPCDWPAVADEGDVYLVLGPPLLGSVLRRGGLQQASVVVIHQLTACVTDDPATVDSQAVFACRLVESLITSTGKDIPVVCDLMLERNAFFIPHVERHMINGLAVVKDAADQDPDKADDDDVLKERKLHTEDSNVPVFTQTRFATGQLYISGIVTTTAANMMFNPSLGSIFREMLSAGYMVLPFDDDFHGKTYSELFTHFLKRRNVLAVGLLRKMDHEDDDGEDEEEEPPDLSTKKGAAAAAAAGALADIAGEEKPAVARWSPTDCPSQRIVIVMPPGEFLVSEQDGVMCMMPTASRPILPPLEDLVAPYSS